MGSCCQLKSGRVWNAAQSMQFLRCFDADKDEHPVRWLLEQVQTPGTMDAVQIWLDSIVAMVHPSAVQMPVSCKFMLSRLGIKR